MIYVHYLLRSMARRGGMRAILATTPESQADRYVAQMVREFSSLLLIETVELTQNKNKILHLIHPQLNKQVVLFNILQNLVKRVSQRISIDYVFIPFLDDYCLFPMVWHARPFRRIPWGGILIRPRFHLRRIGADVPSRWEDLIERFAYRQLLRNKGLDTIFTIDPYLEHYIRSGKLKSVPDPSDILSITPEYSQFGLNSNSVVLLVYGYLDHRKAVDRLLLAMSDERIPKNLTLLLAGKQSSEFTQMMCGEPAQKIRAQGRLIEINRHISENEEASAFRRADMVWNYYPGSYCSSGALVRAGQSSRPVLATREGLVGLTVRDLKMGVTVGEYDDEGLVSALAHLATNSKLRSDLGNAGFEHFSKATPQAFGDPIVDRISDVLRH